LPAEAFKGEHIVGPQTADDDVLRVEHITKRFGPVTALRDINIHLRKGEVLGLLGDNGAGKSTLIKILCGFQKQDSGTMWLKGEPYAPKSVEDARRHGVDVVYQDLALVDELSVFHNVFLNREIVHPIPLLNNRAMRKRATEAINQIGVDIPSVKAPVARLSGGQRQAIAIARSVHSGARILLLDEPLAAMGAKEGEMILDLIHDLKAEGHSMIVVAHNYIHVVEICDRVNLLQHGRITFDKPTAETSVKELTDLVAAEYRASKKAAAAGR
jgi:simple sugar transport system ATP-binding protein